MRSVARKFMIAPIAIAAGLLVPATAAAAAPTKGPVEVIPYQFSADCSPYGFSFDNSVNGQETIWVETFTDSQGSPLRQVAHDRFVETDTNSITGKTLQLTGKRVETLDLAADTRTDVGIDFLMTDPGTGAVIRDIGRVVFDAPFHVSFEAGHHPVLHGDIDALVCNALATS